MDKLTRAACSSIERLCPGGVLRDVSLAALSQWRIGGEADLVIRPSSTEELATLLRWFFDRGIQYVVIGSTSNLLFADEGLRVPCIQIGSRFAGLSITGQKVTAQAGVWVPRLARRLVQAELTGGEHICGIPGSLGGLICMNGGSNRHGIGENVACVESVTKEGVVRSRSSIDCKFTYRKSIYQQNGEIISKVLLEFRPGRRRLIRRLMLEILSSRRLRFPRKLPNCGSVFVSNPEMYAECGPPGAVIERLGYKGRRVGGAMVSSQHANFIVNSGHARATDVISLINEIHDAVLRETGYNMEVEARYVAPDGRMAPARLI